ncbi:MAG: hypothetical protein H6822_14040 [Planctomycetaceae bacterium]|nr:hypothetical protein [Planctomycetales bacterium]MCB9923298.1 hypothetical protein [Planctomycetaceae bacterium]
MRLRRDACLRLLPAFVFFCGGLVAAEPSTFPVYNEVQRIVDQHFGAQTQLRPGDVISQSEVSELFLKLEDAGWKVGDRNDLFKRLLPTNDPLIRILRSTRGIKFMRQVSSDTLIYDRLDRIVQEPGGERLLADLVKLPDAARYAKQKTPPGVPDLEDFLPKGRSGKARQVEDYDKATGKIYTVPDFEKALQKSYEQARLQLQS